MAKAEEIEIDETGFRYQGSKFPYEAVDSLRYFYLVTTNEINFVPVEVDHNVELDIYVSTLSSPISVRSTSLLGFARSKKRANPAIALYQQIAQRTYQIRLAKCIEEFERDGYIYFDGKNFLQQNGIISDGKREIDLTENVQLIKAPFQIIHPAPKTLGRTIKKYFFGIQQDFVIHTQVNSDVLFTILEQYFNLEWDAKGKSVYGDIHITLPITQAQAATGAPFDINFSRKRVCDACTGSENNSKCKTCHGTKFVERPFEIKVRIPAGISDGQRLRVKGEGNSSLSGGAPGDVYIKVSIETAA